MSHELMSRSRRLPGRDDVAYARCGYDDASNKEYLTCKEYLTTLPESCEPLQSLFGPRQSETSSLNPQPSTQTLNAKP